MLLTAKPRPASEEVNQMLDIIKTIQEDRLHEADTQRIISGLARERSLSFGRYRITLSRRGR